ncbi:PAS domain S-box protein [Vacuolonema iberomarrocanum]|uniref:sensor histidine kinase n=1 Tax=Vacuolonema iberomarrocanum TaxID=3454632 RepID=UPI003F6E1EF9
MLKLLPESLAIKGFYIVRTCPLHLPASICWTLPAPHMSYSSANDGSRPAASSWAETLDLSDFQALVENTPDLIVQLTLQGTIQYANRRVEQELGVSITVLLGKPLNDTPLPANVVSLWQTATQQVVATQQEQRVELDWPTLSGAFFWDSRVVPERDEKGQICAVLLISRDTTRLKLAELAVRQEEAHYRAIIDDQIDLICRFDSEGRLTFVNHACCRFVGRDRTDLLHTSILDWVAEDDRLNILQRLQNQLPLLSYDILEIQIPNQQGEGHWIQWTTKAIANEHGVLVEYQSVGRDIHNRKRMEAALHRQIERERTLNRVIQVIRQSLDLNTIFSATTKEIACLLQVDRATIFQYLADKEIWLGRAEYHQNNAFASVLDVQISGNNHSVIATLKQDGVVCETAPIPLPTDSSDAFSGACLVVPLRVGGDDLWGCLCLNHAQTPHTWKDSEIEVVQIVADQLAIAIQQSQLYAQVQYFNNRLERQVRVRTVQLQLANDFEATLKRITDRVRDSLDENQILQTAVKELVEVMGVLCCNAALFDLEKGISIIRYEYTTHLTPSQGRASRMAAFPEIYEPLMRGEYFQFCSMLENPVRDRAAMLACPIQDNQGVLGDLWLISPSFHAFSDQDIRLVQQVANQCAIAIRQARLYQTAQSQVAELERLNSLKDDFLSTVSHELRTPVANIKMAAEMLEIVLDRSGILSANNRQQHPEISRYFRVLRDECRREITLINDILDLSRLDASDSSHELTLDTFQLQQWLPQLVTPYRERAIRQQQQLELDVEPDLPSLTTDFSHLDRILSELLNNACKYTPQGASICLRAQRLASEESTASCQISVSNTGVEINPLECDRIFEKFYRIPQNDPWRHGGTGLGLALVKKLVEQIQGTIHVQSKGNQTEFVLGLPNMVLEE